MMTGLTLELYNKLYSHTNLDRNPIINIKFRFDVNDWILIQVSHIFNRVRDDLLIFEEDL